MQPEPPTAPPDPAVLDTLRGRIVAIDSQVAGLAAQRQALVVEYERVRAALTAGMVGPVHQAVSPTPAMPGPPHPGPAGAEWSGARVRGLLLGLGAILLAISALAFTAVAWSRLGEGGRAALLLTLTTLVSALAVGLRRRLPASAEALAGLAVALTLVDFYAVRRAGAADALPWDLWWAIGTATAAGLAVALGLFVGRRTTWLAAAILLPIGPELLVDPLAGGRWPGSIAFSVLAAVLVATLTALAPRLTSWQRGALRLHALGCWLAAALIATIAAGQALTLTEAVGSAVAMAALAAAPELARRDTIDWTIPAVVVHAVPAAVVLTLARPVLNAGGLLATAVIVGGATMLASPLLPAVRRRPAMIAGAMFAAPGTIAAVLTALPAVLSPLAWLGRPWTVSLARTARDAAADPWIMAYAHQPWPAVGTLGVVAAIGLAYGIHNRRALGITTAAMSFIAALAPLTAGASILVALIATTAAAVAGLLVAALVDRAENGHLWPLLPGATIAALPATGWAAVSPGASVAGLAAGSAGAVGATLIARPASAARQLFAALATVLLVALAGVGISAAGAGAAAGGFAAALAAGAAIVAGVHLLRGARPVGTAVEITGALSALVALAVAASSAPWLAAALTALAPLAAVAASQAHTAANVGVVEAYTAPAALVVLIAGLLSRRTGPGRSWASLGPALALTIGPTLALGLADQDAPRLVISAALSFAAVLAGAVRRLQAPLIVGSVALVMLAIDQWGADIVRLPRWITIGVIGIALMWIGATFEHRRRDWRRATHTLGRFG